MDLQTLKTELETDPLERGYSGMSDQEAADDLNAVYRTRQRRIIPAHEVIEATAAAEFTALSAAEKQRYQILVSAGDINVQGTNTRAAFAAMFGAGTTTRTNLLALQNENVSRAAELGLEPVTVQHVADARAA